VVRILFILKYREQNWGDQGYHLSSGLYNSVRFIVDMLNMLGIPAKMVQVQDNNCIDREVTAYRPTHVIVEAFWVVPEKFDVLMRLHPFVHWAVRDHSETPFIANEGVFTTWLFGYLRRGVEVTVNAPRALIDLQAIGRAYGYSDLISYSPNYYPVLQMKDHAHLIPHPPHADNTIRVGCFGAIRPLKNQLVQAIAAIRFADMLGRKLEFHINHTRIEGGANPILRNLQGLFANTPRAKLVEVPWLVHDKFLDVLRDMDICLQVSFSETFNIVTADSVVCSVPVVVSKEVPWLGTYAQADPNDSTSILTQMLNILRQDRRARLQWQFRDLTNYCVDTMRIWWDRYGHGRFPLAIGVPDRNRMLTMDAKRPHRPPQNHGKPERPAKPDKPEKPDKPDKPDHGHGPPDHGHGGDHDHHGPYG
jgi:hypothetical protein